MWFNIFLKDYEMFNMEEGFSHGSVPIILGRPFMKTARTKIDVYAGTLSMVIFGNIRISNKCVFEVLFQ